MKYNTQTDPRWAKKIMTQKKGQWTDYIWRWGCLVACLANIIQDIRKKDFTPKDLNDLIINIKAYAYLDNPNTAESQASNLLWGKIEKYFSKSLKFDYKLSPDEYENNRKLYFIARVKHDKTGMGHYINLDHVQDKKYVCFDVETGKFRTYKKNEITFLHKVENIL